MKSGLAEILKTGKAPGMNTKAQDPGCADVAVPRAFKQLEQTESADKIARAAGHSIKTIKKAWNM